MDVDILERGMRGQEKESKPGVEKSHTHTKKKTNNREAPLFRISLSRERGGRE